MSKKMYELTKQILSKVSFDQFLFEKELKKSFKWLKSDEALLLKAWCLATFGHLYRDLILDAYETII